MLTSLAKAYSSSGSVV